MSRFYDRLMISSHVDENYLESLKNTIVILAKNVSDFYFEYKIRRFDNDLKEDFPSLAPPFPNFFIETTAPNIIQKNVLVLGDSLIPRQTTMALAWGIHCCAQKDEKSGWVIMADLYFELNRKYNVYGPIWTTVLNVDDQGEPIYCKGYHTGIGHFDEGQRSAIMNIVKNSLNKKIEILEERDLGFRHLYYYPLFMAISFMHCKNVTLETIEPNKKLNKKFQKNHGGFLIKYHTLQVESIKKILKKEGKIESQGLERALHICRGHFKDYRESGLFGKIPGIFWWDAQARGQRKKGIILKDYEIGKSIPYQNSS